MSFIDMVAIIASAKKFVVKAASAFPAVTSGIESKMRKTKDVRSRYQKEASRVAPIALHLWSLSIFKMYEIILIDTVLESLSVPVKQRRSLDTVGPERI